MGVIDRRDGLEVLDRDECLDLLAAHAGGVGRVGIVEGLHPVILPVNFALDGDHVAFRTSAGTKLDAALHDALVCFEIDHLDDDDRIGWSVVVRGRSEVVVEHAVRDRLESLGVRPWTAATVSNWVRIAPETVTGRRIPPRT
jgi:nitroimidazol reductase NimA-like FMN-containing flavoprotein (pyridoxamine 5'-phosphate oxidase superfamily)